MTKEKKIEIFLVFALISIAIFLRLFSLEDIPPGLAGDEAVTGLEAKRILKEGWIGPYTGMALGTPLGLSYFVALFFKFLEPSIFTLRLATATLGILSILLGYIFFKLVFGKWVAFIASFLMTFSYFHIHLSHVACVWISILPFQFLTLIFLFLGLKNKKKINFWLTGIFLGLTSYTSTISPFFWILVFGVLIWKVITDRDFPIIKEAIVVAIVALLISIPAISYMTKTNYIKNRMNLLFQSDYQNFIELSLPAKISFLAERGFNSIKQLFTQTSLDHSDGLGRKGLIDPFTSVFSLIGLAVALRNYRNYKFSIVLLGLLVGLLVPFLSSPEWGGHRRVMIGFPFLILAASLGILTVLKLFKNSIFSFLILIPLFVFVPFYNIDYYFKKFPNTQETKWIFAYELTQAIDYLKTIDPQTVVYFYSKRWPWNYETRRFLLPSMKGEDRSREFGEFTIEKRNKKVAYLLMSDYLDLLKEIKEKYPNGKLHEQKEAGKTIFAVYSLNAI